MNHIYPVNAKKQTTNWMPAKFRKIFRPSYITKRIQRLDVNRVALDEPPQDLHCLIKQLFSPLVLKDI